MLLLLLLIPSLLRTETIQNPEFQEMVKQAAESVVLIQVFNEDDKLVSFGSGFVIAPGFIATNLHVVAGGSRVLIKRHGDDTGITAEGVIASNSKTDLAVLAASRLVGVRGMSLGNSAAVHVGEAVYVLGNPLGLEGSLSAGIISARRIIDGSDLFQLTAPISPGSSGSAVINGKGEVIGVAVGTKEGGQNINFAIPSQDLAFIWENRVHVKSFQDLGPVESLGRSQSASRDSFDYLVYSDRAELVPEFGKFLLSAGLTVERTDNILSLDLDVEDDGEVERFLLEPTAHLDGQNAAFIRIERWFRIKEEVRVSRNQQNQLAQLVESMNIVALDYEINDDYTTLTVSTHLSVARPLEIEEFKSSLGAFEATIFLAFGYYKDFFKFLD